MSHAKVFTVFKSTCLLGASFSALLSVSSVAWADPAMDQNAPEGAKKDWQATLGGGVALNSVYQGSRYYVASPLPLISATWRDTVSFGYDGLMLSHRIDTFRFGGGVTFDPGRKDDGKTLFGTTSGDTRLKGMGNIDPAAGFKAFASYALPLFSKAPPIVFDTSVIKLTGGNNDGVLVKTGVFVPFHFGESWRLTPKVAMTWADDTYMQDYFGVTSEQAAKSQFSTYKAQSGIKDASIGINLGYAINKNWFVSGEVSATQLFNDAASSPISATNTSVSVVTMLGYHF